MAGGMAAAHPPVALCQSPGIAFGRAVHVSAARPALPHVEPHLALDPVHPDNLLAVSMVYTKSGTWAGPGIYRSTDGGMNWSPVALADSGTAVDPWVSFDGRGNAYFLHLPGRIHVSSDGGATWKPALDLPLDASVPLDFPKIAAPRMRTATDPVYVVSAASARDPAGLPIGPVLIFRSTRDGTFEESARILPGFIDYQIATPAVVLPDGRLVVAFSELTHHGELLPPFRIWITRSADEGSTFPPPSLVAGDGGGNVSMAVDRSGGPFQGRLYLAFLSATDWELYLQHSDDAGLSWSAPAKINDTALRRSDAPATPMLAVDRGGTLGILWSDFRGDSNRRCYAVYFAYSNDGGKSVSTDTPVPGTRSCPNAPGGDQMKVDRPNGQAVYERYPVGGDYYGLVARPDGKFQALWSDARSGVFQLWTTTIGLPAPRPSR